MCSKQGVFQHMLMWKVLRHGCKAAGLTKSCGAQHQALGGLVEQVAEGLGGFLLQPSCLLLQTCGR